MCRARVTLVNKCHVAFEVNFDGIVTARAHAGCCPRVHRTHGVGCLPPGYIITGLVEHNYVTRAIISFRKKKSWTCQGVSVNNFYTPSNKEYNAPKILLLQYCGFRRACNSTMWSFRLLSVIENRLVPRLAT